MAVVFNAHVFVRVHDLGVEKDFIVFVDGQLSVHHAMHCIRGQVFSSST